MAYYGFATDYGMISGTSMACPHVAGAAALIWQHHPEWTHVEVKEAILATVDIPTPVLECVSSGRLNLYDALNYRPPLISLTVEDDVSDDPNSP
ncbi:MAG TPA: S8 family serine peptidase, partial [Anaerohalosphaeraceae bacterium]|nr:S8 family serine peptidase [Anaerohalosphaeraceae bacterium]